MDYSKLLANQGGMLNGFGLPCLPLPVKPATHFEFPHQISLGARNYACRLWSRCVAPG